jgi:hydrogenase maturation factor
MMAGTAQAGGLLDKSKMRAGDRVLLTKGVAVEGTWLIAREFGAQLAGKGMTAAEIASSASFLDKIGILEEARICQAHPGASALHDVTEGGLATAVGELAAAGGFRLRVNMETIPVYPETRRICEALGQGNGIEAYRDGVPVSWPHFDRDEVSRLVREEAAEKRSHGRQDTLACAIVCPRSRE